MNTIINRSNQEIEFKEAGMSELDIPSFNSLDEESGPRDDD